MTDNISEKAKIIEMKYKYKRMIMEGKIKPDIDTAKKLVGPDCAYHLYQKDIKDEK